jgi:hypothetical protein
LIPFFEEESYGSGWNEGGRVDGSMKLKVGRTVGGSESQIILKSVKNCMQGNVAL